MSAEWFVEWEMEDAMADVEMKLKTNHAVAEKECSLSYR